MPCRWQADFFPAEKQRKTKPRDAVLLSDVRSSIFFIIIKVKAASQKCRDDPNGIKQGVSIDITVEFAVIGIRAVLPRRGQIPWGALGSVLISTVKRTESFPLPCSEIMHHEKTANVFVNQCQQFRNEAANRECQPVFIKE